MARTFAALTAILLLGVSGCGPVNPPTLADPANIKRLATVGVVVPEQTGAFTVMNARVQDSTGAVYGGVFGGLIGFAIGAAVDASIKSSSDSRDTERIAVTEPRISGRAAFADAIRTAVQRSGRSGIEIIDRPLVGEERRNYAAVAVLQIKDWGLRRVGETEPPQVAVFVDVDATLTRSADNETLWREQETVVGRSRADLKTYHADHEALRREMEETFSAAGHRMAMQILYPRSPR